LIDKGSSLWEKEVGGNVVTIHLEKRIDEFWPAFVVGPVKKPFSWSPEGIDPQSQFTLGILYESGGAGFDVNLQKAFDQFKVSAERGYHPSQLKLGIIYQSGRQLGYPINNDPILVIQWLEEAAKNGNDIAVAQLAATYHYGLGGVTISYKNASRWYQTQEKNAEAVFHHGQLYEQNLPSEEWSADIDKAVDLWIQSADMGSPEASYKLGIVYYDGLHLNSKKVEKNLKAAKRYFEKAYRLSPEKQFLPPADLDDRIASEEREAFEKAQKAKKEAEQSSILWRNISIFAGVGLLGAFLLHRAASS